MLGPKGPFCQSCGMPMEKDERGGGTELDGTKSVKYCSRCYENGKFCNPDMTVDGMKQLVKGKLQSMGFPGFIAHMFIKNIHKLERWHGQN